jgi:hypothetical protein
LAEFNSPFKWYSSARDILRINNIKNHPKRNPGYLWMLPSLRLLSFCHN